MTSLYSIDQSAPADVTGPCDCGCGEQWTAATKIQLLTHVRGSRMNEARGWTFASREHADAWYATGDTTLLSDSSEAADVDLTLDVWSVRPGNLADLVESSDFADGEALNTYWQTPGEAPEGGGG